MSIGKLGMLCTFIAQLRTFLQVRRVWKGVSLPINCLFCPCQYNLFVKDAILGNGDKRIDNWEKRQIFNKIQSSKEFSMPTSMTALARYQP